MSTRFLLRPLGFPWTRQRGESAPKPPSAAVLANVRRLEIRTRWLVDSLLGGEYRSVFSGRGMELSHVRAYQAGDDVRQIDWKVTARRGTPYVRCSVEERDLVVTLVVDISGSGGFGPGERSAAEVAAEIAAALAFAATRNNDRVGLVLVSDRVERFIAPASGRNHAIRLLSDLLTHRPAGTGTDLTKALEELERRIPGRGIVFVISDFMQNHHEPGYRAALGRTARARDLVAIRLASRATAELPAVGWVELLDPETGRRVTVNTASRSVREKYRRSVARAGAEMASFFGEIGAEIVEIDTTRDPLPPVAGFFARRRIGVR